MRTKIGSLLTVICCLALTAWAQGQTSLVKITDCTTSSSAIGKVGADGTPSCTNPAPGGAASGDLGGSYPNPSVAKINGGSVPASAGVLGTNSSSQPIAATATGVESPRIATATGSANAYVVTLSPAITSYTNFCGEFIANFGNTGAATANFNGLGAKNVTKNGITATALASGDIGNGQTVSVCYDGTQLEMMSPVANASSGGAPGLPAGSLQKESSGSFAGIPGTPSLFSQVGTPSAPTITNGGTAGSTTYTYKAVGRQSSLASAGHTPASGAGSTTTGNATLSSTNFNILTVAPIYGAACYDWYRTAGGASTGLIQACGGTVLDDTGLAGDSSTAPTTDTTLMMANPAPLPGCAIAMGGKTGPDAPHCTPEALDDFFGESVLSNQWTWGNQGTSTASLTSGSLVLTPQDCNTCDAVRYLFQAAPSTPWTVTVRAQMIDQGSSAGGWRKVGMMVSDGTKLELLELALNNSGTPTFIIAIDQYTNSSTFSSTPSSVNIVTLAGLDPYALLVGYLRIQNDGTNLRFSTSPDNINWNLRRSELKGSFLTTGPTQVGVFAMGNNTTASIAGRFDFFEQTQ